MTDKVGTDNETTKAATAAATASRDAMASPKERMMRWFAWEHLPPAPGLMVFSMWTARSPNGLPGPCDNGHAVSASHPGAA